MRVPTTDTSTPVSRREQARRDREYARDRLRDLLHPGDTVYTSIAHVARSGMSRLVRVYLVSHDEHRIVDATGYVARALGLATRRASDCEGLAIRGCGFDPGYEVAHELGYALYPEYPCLGRDCPSNDHVNDPQGWYTTHVHGYALRHASL